jgi:putative transposon-encoded protein
MERRSMTVNFYGMVDRDVKDGVTSGRVFVPKAWIGKKVGVYLLEELPAIDE